MATKAASKTKVRADEDTLQITQARYDALVAELKHRQAVVAEEIANAIAEARQLGDLSENQPYTEAMERKEMNDARITQIEFILATAEIVAGGGDKNVVDVGDTVEVERVGDKSKKQFTLVGKSQTQEADPKVGKVSVDSPIGKALHKAKLGDTVVVSLPTGKVQYKLLKMVA